MKSPQQVAKLRESKSRKCVRNQYLNETEETYSILGVLGISDIILQTAYLQFESTETKRKL